MLIKNAVSLVDQQIRRRATAYLSEASGLSLEEFCETLAGILHLPDFVYDGENEYQWGFVQLEQGTVEINISCLYEPEPSGLFDYTISFIVSEAASPEFSETWLSQSLTPTFLDGLKSLREINNDNHTCTGNGSPAAGKSRERRAGCQ